MSFLKAITTTCICTYRITLPVGIPVDPTFCYYASKLVKQGLTVLFEFFLIFMDGILGIGLLGGFHSFGLTPIRSTFITISGSASGSTSVLASSDAIAAFIYTLWPILDGGGSSYVSAMCVKGGGAKLHCSELNVITTVSWPAESNSITCTDEGQKVTLNVLLMGRQ